MKKKDRLSVISKVVKEYNDKGNKFLNRSVKPSTIKTWLIDGWMKCYKNDENINVTLYENHYCCNGLWSCCWFDILYERLYGYTRKDMVDAINELFEDNNLYKFKKKLNKENRIFIDETSDKNHTFVLIVLRDVYLIDFLIDIDYEKVVIV